MRDLGGEAGSALLREGRTEGLSRGKGAVGSWAWVLVLKHDRCQHNGNLCLYNLPIYTVNRLTIKNMSIIMVSICPFTL